MIQWIKKSFVWLALTLSLSGQAWSQEWKGHLATLWDAQTACSDTYSKDCEPFLAEAVAVADVMYQLSSVDMKAKENEFVVPIPGGNQMHCSNNWLKSMNGLGLLHSTLGLSLFDDPKSIPWTTALMRASQQLCHS
jgi:hypothetical protein